MRFIGFSARKNGGVAVLFALRLSMGNPSAIACIAILLNAMGMTPFFVGTRIATLTLCLVNDSFCVLIPEVG